MASSYTTLLRFIKMANGENSATWGTNLNTLFDSLDDAIAGMATLSTTGGTYTLSTANNSDDEARNAILKVTGVLVSNSEVVVPASTKRYTVWNATTGSYTCTVKTSGGSGIAVTQGKVMDLFCDGTNVKAVNTELQSPTITGATLTTPTITIADNLLTIQDNSDTTKQAQFQLSSITAGQTRTLTVPDASGTIALTSDIVSAAITNSTYTKQTLTDGATINWDANNGSIGTVTLGGNRTMAAPTNLTTGYYTLVVIQDSTGSRTITWNSVFKWDAATAPVLSTAASAKDVLSFYCDGTNLYGGIAVRGAA